MLIILDDIVSSGVNMKSGIIANLYTKDSVAILEPQPFVCLDLCLTVENVDSITFFQVSNCKKVVSMIAIKGICILEERSSPLELNIFVSFTP